MATDLIPRYLANLREASSSERTINDRQWILTTLDRDLPCGLDAACTDELRAWLWRDGLSLSSRETYYGAIASFYRWAHKAGQLDYDPSEEMPRPKPPRRLPRPITDDELRRVLTEADEPYRLWMLLSAYAGLRCIEIYRMRREYITEQVMMVHLGKGAKPRAIATHPLIWAAVKDLPVGPLAHVPDERYISIRAAVYLRRKLLMPGVSLHRGRHWFGTTVQRLYKDLRVTQELMGHADPRSTAGYAQVSNEQATAAVGMLPTLGGGADGGRRTGRVPL